MGQASASWRADKRKTAERGYGGRWQRARLKFLAKHPLCAFCEEKGRTELASVVDHIKPHKGDETLFWDESNWQALCKTCHDSDKKLIEAGTQRQEIGIDGWPV